jgi:hypothetical protein
VKDSAWWDRVYTVMDMASGDGNWQTYMNADAVMVWDEGTCTVRWVWDERIAWKPSCAKCDSGFSEHRCHMEDR